MLLPSLAHCQNRAISLSHTRTYTGRAYSLGITIIGMTLQEFTTRSAEHEPALSAAPQPSPQNLHLMAIFPKDSQKLRGAKISTSFNPKKSPPATLNTGVPGMQSVAPRSNQ